MTRLDSQNGSGSNATFKTNIDNLMVANCMRLVRKFWGDKTSDDVDHITTDTQGTLAHDDNLKRD